MGRDTLRDRGWVMVYHEAAWYFRVPWGTATNATAALRVLARA